jgi:oxygen-independent coproporphyrinogen-3 oxidase
VTLGAYVHVPFCSSRCGYCDFNTYTALELQRDGATVSLDTYASRVVREIELTRQSVATREPISTVFFGGGTPTLLAPSDIGRIIDSLHNQFGLESDSEVTVEANPDSVSAQYLQALREAGVTRVSFGHQSSAPHVLALLERTHTPGRTWDAVQWARSAGFDHVSVDLIYASQVETTDDLHLTLTEVLAADLDHVSAYSLIVEPGTRMGSAVQRGELPTTNDEVAAQRYELIDAALTSAGFQWYEVSNWAKDGGQCRHNMGYWRSDDWLGIGPGAHALVGDTRSWNIKHPAAWAARIDAGVLAVDDTEIVNDEIAQRENIMLRLRLREGLPAHFLSPTALGEAQLAQAEGLLAYDHSRGSYVLTNAGRLLADGIVARLWA